MTDVLRLALVEVGGAVPDAFATALAASSGLAVVAIDEAPDCVLLIDGDAEAVEAGLPAFRAALAALEGSAAMYTDELALRSDSGVPILVQKPGFDPERLRCQYYLGTIVAYTAQAWESLGGLREDLPWSVRGYDLALRAVRAGVAVEHYDIVPVGTAEGPRLGAIPAEASDSVRSVLERHLAATGGGAVEAISLNGIHRTRRPVVGEPLVSIVIPTRGQSRPRGGVEHSYLVDAVRGIVERSSYRNVEIVIVHDSVASPTVLQQVLQLAGETAVLVEWTAPFNFSAKINWGVLHSRGEFVLLLNDDVDVISPDWIERLLALAQLPGSGMSGGMLYYQDDTVQHGGHHYWRGDAKHIAMYFPRGDPGPLGGLRVERQVAGVTAACALMPRSVYDQVGGMTQLLPSAFNDVDLCMKVAAAGYRIFWTPYAELYHFESKSRDPTVRKWEVDVAWGRWSRNMHQPQFWPYPD